MSIALSITQAREKFSATCVGAGEFSDDAVVAGEIFRQLQELRQAADYDPGYRISRNETLRLIEGVRQAIGLINRLDADERKLLAARLIGRTRS